MGLAKDSPVKEPLADKIVSLLHKAGYEVIYPRHMENLCCGTIWESKGMPDVARTAFLAWNPPGTEEPGISFFETTSADIMRKVYPVHGEDRKAGWAKKQISTRT